MIQFHFYPIKMDHEVLQGRWQNKQLDIIIQCYQQSKQLFVKINNTDKEIINGSYFSVSDGIMLTFYIIGEDKMINYAGKLFNQQPHVMQLEALTTINRDMKHYKQDKWSLYDTCDHENIILTKKSH